MTQPTGIDLGERVQQPCHGCGAVDDHPRHIVINSFAEDTQNSVKHFDCCNCAEHCQPALASANGKKGLELAAHMVQLAQERGAVDNSEGIELEGGKTPVIDFSGNTGAEA